MNVKKANCKNCNSITEYSTHNKMAVMKCSECGSIFKFGTRKTGSFSNEVVLISEIKGNVNQEVNFVGLE